MKIKFYISLFAFMIIFHLHAVDYNWEKEPYEIANEYQGILTLPNNLKSGLFVYRLVNVTENPLILDMKSIIYPLLCFEAFCKTQDEESEITSICKENKLGFYWESENLIETQSVGSTLVKNYNLFQRMRHMRTLHWTKNNPIALPPATYIGNIIPANRVVVLPPLLTRMRENKDKVWNLRCKTKSFYPGEAVSVWNILPQSPDSIYTLNFSNAIKMDLELVEKMLKVDIESVLLKKNDSEYITHMELIPERNTLFVDIIAKVPMRIYIKDEPYTVNSPDRSKRISLRTLDTSEWKWIVKTNGKTLIKTGPAMTFPKIDKKNSSPWMLRHELIGRRFNFYKSPAGSVIRKYFKQPSNSGKCTVVLEIPLYLPDKSGRMQKSVLLKTEPLTVTRELLTQCRDAFIEMEKEKLNLPPKEYIEKLRRKRSKLSKTHNK